MYNPIEPMATFFIVELEKMPEYKMLNITAARLIREHFYDLYHIKIEDNNNEDPGYISDYFRNRMNNYLQYYNKHIAVKKGTATEWAEWQLVDAIDRSNNRLISQAEKHKKSQIKDIVYVCRLLKLHKPELGIEAINDYQETIINSIEEGTQLTVKNIIFAFKRMFPGQQLPQSILSLIS